MDIKKFGPLLAALILVGLLSSPVESASSLPDISYSEFYDAGFKLKDTGGGSITPGMFEGGTGERVVYYLAYPREGPDGYPSLKVVVIIEYYTSPENYAAKKADDLAKKYYGFPDSTETSTDMYGEPYEVVTVSYDTSLGPPTVVKTVTKRTHPKGDEPDCTCVDVDYFDNVGGSYFVSVKLSYSDGSAKAGKEAEALLPELYNMVVKKISEKAGVEGETVTAEPTTSSQEPEQNGRYLSPKAEERMKKTNERLKALGRKWGGFITLKTPRGEVVKVINSDPDYSGGSSVLGWKAKYYGNKGLDLFIDKVAGHLPLSIGLFKDYFKADKDINLFSDEEMVKKTAKDLHVDGKSASLYNRMSDIDNREKALSPYKNAVPTGVATKPIEMVINSMGTAIKKTLAQDYRWEFEQAAKAAIEYKRAGMKYREIIRLTVNEVRENTEGMHRVNMMNRNSQGGFRDQETRIRFYLNRLYEEGVI